MGSLADIREGLATNLSVIPGWQVSAYQLSNPLLPSLQVMGLDEIQYDRAMGRGLDDWMVSLMAFAGITTDIGSQKLLDSLIETSAVKDAVESDKTLGGVAADVRVTECAGYRAYVLGTNQVIGCEWKVRVLVAGN